MLNLTLEMVIVFVNIYFYKLELYKIFNGEQRMSEKAEKIDINHLNKWLGKEDLVTDYVTPIVEQRYRATLNMDLGEPQLGELT